MPAQDSIRTVRYFVSSSSDMGCERDIARKIFKRLQAEFAAYLDVQPYYWEDEPMWGQHDYQTSIPDPGKFDVFLCFLGSRLGMPLDPARYSRADGSTYRSGTVYELEQALKAYHASGGEPQLLIYHRKSMPPIPHSLEEASKTIQNALEMQNLIHEWQRDSTYGAYFSQAINSYESVEEFEFKLEKAIRDDLRSRVPAALPLPLPTTWVHGSPFRGLRVFDFQHSPIFHGRTRAVGDIFASLKNQDAAGSPFVLIGGSSGVGKSSLVRAGLLPMLFGSTTEFAAGSWRYAVLCPADVRDEKDDLCAVLVRALTRDATPSVRSQRDIKAMSEPPEALPEILSATTLSALTDMARTDLQCFTGHIIATLNQISASLGAPVRLCLFLDQLEELFTLGWITPDIRERFFAAITSLVTSGRVVVLATIRVDFLQHCESVPSLMDLKQKEGYYHLQAPTSDEIGRMIRLPAQAAGLHFETDAQGRSLDALLMAAMKDSNTALPMLEFTLQCLYDRAVQRTDNADADSRLRIEDYEKLGKLEGAIATKAQETFENLSPEGQSAFDEVLRLCVTQTKDSPAVRREALTESVEAIAGGQEFAHAFINARLLVAATREARDDGPPVRVLSLAHEALLRHWQKLFDFLKQEQDFLLVRNQVESLASVWESVRAKDGASHDEQLMANGSLLFAAEEALKQHPLQFTPAVTDYITRSIRARDKAKRWLWGWVVVLVTLLVLSAGAGSFAAFQWRQAEEARVLAEQQTQRAEKAKQSSLRYMDTLLSDVCEQLRDADNWPLLTKIYNAIEMFFVENPPSADRFEQRLYAKFLVESNYKKRKENPVDVPLIFKNYETALAIWEAEEKLTTDTNNLVWHMQNRANIIYVFAQFVKKDVKDAARAISMMEQAAALSTNAYELSKNEYYKTTSYTPLLLIADCHIENGKYDEAIKVCKDVLATLTVNKGRLTAIERWNLNRFLLKILQIFDKDKKKYADDILKYGKECLKNVQVLLSSRMNDYGLHMDFALVNVYMHEALDTKKDNSAAKYLDLAIEKLTILTTSVPDNTDYQKWLKYCLDHRKTCGQARDTENQRIAERLHSAGSIEDAIPYYKKQADADRKFAQENAGNPKAWQHATTSSSKFGEVLSDTGNAKAALEQFTATERILREQIAATPQQPQLEKELADCLENMAKTQNTLGMLPDALKNQQAALDARNRFLQLAPNDATAQEDIWESMYVLSKLHLQNGDHQTAVALLRERLRENEALLASDTRNENLQKRVSLYATDLADAELQMGDTEKALKHYTQSLHLDEALLENDHANGDKQNDLAFSLAKMAEFHIAQNNIEEALKFQEKSLQLTRELADMNPRLAWLQENLDLRLRTQIELMYNNDAFWDDKKAVNAAKEALEVKRRLAGIKPDIPDEWMNLAAGFGRAGDIFKKSGNDQEALNYYMQASRIVIKAVDNVPHNLEYLKVYIYILEEISSTCLSLGYWDWAIASYMNKLTALTSMATLEPDNGEHLLQQAKTYHNIGIVKNKNDDKSGASEAMQICISVLYDSHKKYPNDNTLQVDISEALLDASEFMFFDLNIPVAVHSMNDSLSWLRAVIEKNPDDESLKDKLHGQLFKATQVYRNLENSEGSLALLRERVQLRRDAAMQYPQDFDRKEQLHIELYNLATALVEDGKPGEAIPLYDECLAHFQPALLIRTDDKEFQTAAASNLAFTQSRMGKAYVDMGASDKAAKQFELSIATSRKYLKRYPEALSLQVSLVYALNDLYTVKPPRTKQASIALLKESLNLALQMPKGIIMPGEKSLADYIRAVRKELKTLQSDSKKK